MNRSMPGLPVHHQLLEFTQTHAHWVSDAIQPSHPLSSPSPPTFSLPQHQDLFKWVSSSHQVDKVVEFQLQHQSFQDWFQTLDMWNWRRHVLCPQCHCQGVDDPSWCFSHISYGSKLRVWAWTKSDGAVWGKKIFRWGKGRVYCLGLQFHALISPVTFFPLHSNLLEAEFLYKEA